MGVHSIDNDGNFSFCVPISSLFGFAEDYRKMIVNAKHKFVLIRSATDKNTIQWNLQYQQVLHLWQTLPHPKSVKVKFDWRIPYVTLSDERRVSFSNN